MKACSFILVLLLACSWFSLAWAQPLAEAVIHPWKVEFELGTGSYNPIDKESGEVWESGTASNLGLTYIRSISPKFELRTGLSEQFTYGYEKIFHAYPYMMDLQVRMRTQSTRLLAGLDYKFRQNQAGTASFYVGGSFYSDLIHNATAKIRKNYISGAVTDDFDIKDSFSGLLPGFQLQLGMQTNIGKAEIRYWQDLNTFTLPNVPRGNQQRSSIGINLSVYLRKGAPEQ